MKGHYVSFDTMEAAHIFQNSSGSAVDSRLLLCLTVLAHLNAGCHGGVLCQRKVNEKVLFNF